MTANKSIPQNSYCKWCDNLCKLGSAADNRNVCYCYGGEVAPKAKNDNFWWRDDWRCRRGNVNWYSTGKTKDCEGFCKGDKNKINCGRYTQKVTRWLCVFCKLQIVPSVMFLNHTAIST